MILFDRGLYNYEFQRVAIVNRGEAAMRFIHAAREYNQEHDTSLRTIAFFTDAIATRCLSAKQTKPSVWALPGSVTRKRS